MFKVPKTLLLEEKQGDFQVKPDHALSELAARVDVSEPVFLCSYLPTQNAIEVPNEPSRGWKLLGFNKGAIFQAPPCYQNKLIFFPLSSLNILSNTESLEKEELIVVLDSENGFNLIKAALLNNSEIAARRTSDLAFLEAHIQEEHHGLVVYTQVGKTKHYGIIVNKEIVGLKNTKIKSTLRLWEFTEDRLSEEIIHQICHPAVSNSNEIELVEVDYLTLKSAVLLNTEMLAHVGRFHSMCIPLVPSGSCDPSLPPLQQRSAISASEISQGRTTNLHVPRAKLSFRELSVIVKGSEGTVQVEDHNPSLSFTPKNLHAPANKPAILGLFRRTVGITPYIRIKTASNKIEISLEAKVNRFHSVDSEVCWKRTVATAEDALIVLEALIRINEPMKCVAAHFKDTELTSSNLFICSTF
jgi:hypothetical protein